MVEMRRGYGKWLAIALVIAATAAALPKLGDGTQDWPSAVVLLSNLGLVMGPLAIGVAAFAGGRAKRRGTTWLERSTPHGRLRAATIEGAAVTIWASLGYLVVLLICFVPTWAQATWSGPDVPRVLASAGGILAQTLIGYYIGRALPFALTAPCLATASFSVTAIVNSASNSRQLALFLPVNLNGYDFYNRTSAAASLTELAYYASCAALVVFAWTLVTTTRLWAVSLASVGLVALIGTSFALTTFHGQSNAEGVMIEFSCAGRNPVICTHPATRDAEAQLRARFADVVDLLAQTSFAIDRAEQRPRGIGSSPTVDAVGFGLDDRSSAAISEARLELAHNAISQRAHCADRTGAPKRGASPDAPTLIAALGDRIAFGSSDTNSDFDTDARVNAAISFILSRSDSQFRDLLDRRASEIKQCSITSSSIASS